MSIESQYPVSGMTCEHCVRAVTDALTALPGVEDVTVDLSTGVVGVHSRRPIDQPDAERTVEGAGYVVTR